MQTPSYEQIKAMPKLEMHIHLEGTIDPALVKEMADSLGVDLPRPLDDLYETTDLSLFLSTLDWVCSLVRSPEQAARIAGNFGRYCRDENIVYTEVIVNPTHWKGMHYQELFPALSRAFDQVEQDYGVDVRMLPSILRQQSAEEALQLVQWMGRSRVPRILGLSIDGNESAAGRTGPRFAPAYALARELGFGCTTHAGESSGAEGVRDALDLLKADRIDHGIKVIEDPALAQRLVDENITLNVCLSSNCALLYGSLDKHPFLKLRELGVPMTLNTDDPVVLKTTLSKELHWAASELPLSLDDLLDCQRQAVSSAFCNQDTKNRLLIILDHFPTNEAITPCAS